MLLSHVLECRRRLLHVSVFFLVCFIGFFYWSAELFSMVVAPLSLVLPTSNSLIATQVTAPVFTPVRLAMNVACLITAPFALYQLWAFVSPGLYPQERVSIRGILVASLLLFLLGVMACFYGILPFMFHMFARMSLPGVRFMPDITDTLAFILHMLCLFGCCFQLPLVCVVLVRMGVLTVPALKALRPYVIVFAFIVGMLLTPPDVLSQIMLAVPLCLLYECGVLVAQRLHKPHVGD